MYALYWHEQGDRHPTLEVYPSKKKMAKRLEKIVAEEDRKFVLDLFRDNGFVEWHGDEAYAFVDSVKVIRR